MKQVWVMKHQLLFKKILTSFYFYFVLGQLECFLPTVSVFGVFLFRIFPHLDWIERFTKFRIELSAFFPQLNVITGCDTTPHKFYVEKVNVFKACKDTSSFTLIKILGLNITLTEEIV